MEATHASQQAARMLGPVQRVCQELWGEVIGDDELFAAGQRHHMIGRLECYRGLNQAEAAQQVDQLLS